MLRRLAPFVLLAGCASSSIEPAPSSTDIAVVEQSGWRFELQARASEDPWAPSGTYRLPAGAAIKNGTPSINAAGDVALDFRAGDGLQHAWKNGQIVFDVTDPKGVISDTSLDGAGNLAFDVMGASIGNGIYVHHVADGTTSFFSSEPLGAESWTSIHLFDDGRVGCRPSSGERRFIGFPEKDGFRKLAVETSTSPSSPYQYLFSPAFDARGNAVVKVWLASGGNDIRVLASGASPRVVAEDKEKNPASPLDKLDNGVAVNDRGQIAFIAKSGPKRAVFRTDGTTTERLATEGEDGVGTIAYFTPAIDAAGRVAFKGEDPARKNTIWIADGARVERLIGAGDALPSDAGEVLALPETDYDPMNRVVFGGGLAMTPSGDLAFLAALAKQDANGTHRYGTGVYVAKRAR